MRSFPRSFLVLIAVCLLVQGCAGRPLGVLIPSEKSVEGASTVDMLVATTRAAAEDKGFLFSGERAEEASVTHIKVSIPPAANRQVGQVQWPQRLPADLSREFGTLKIQEMKSRQAARQWLLSNLPKSGRVMIFVHGFNNRYEDAVYRFAQVVHDSGADVAPILFTWPSRASIFDYNYDKESTNYSRNALENILRDVALVPQVKEVTIMAHSMGTWLAVESLRQMAIRDKRIAPKIKDVILASPDIDVDVFARQWHEMGDKKPKFTVFVSRDDRALMLSRRISGNVDRLGQINPEQEPYRTQLTHEGITVIDLTAMKGGDRLNHGKFADSPEVVKLIGERLLNGQTITDSDVGFGERIGIVALGATQTVGNAAGAAISAPIAVFDPATRRSYGRQIERVGQSVGSVLGADGTSGSGARHPVQDIERGN